MDDSPIKSPSLEVTALDLAQIKTLILFNERHAATVNKVLRSKGVSRLEDLDEISLKNVLRYLLSS